MYMFMQLKQQSTYTPNNKTVIVTITILDPIHISDPAI